MTHNRIHISTLILTVVALLLTMLPLTGCHSGAKKSSDAKAVKTINEAIEAKNAPVEEPTEEPVEAVEE